MEPEGFYVGRLGSLVSFPGFVGQLDVSHDDGVTLHTNLAGRRWAHVSATRPSRQWSVDIPALTPEEVSVLLSLVYERQPGYVWVSMEAAASNVLTPEASLVADSGVRVGGWRRDDGVLVPQVAYLPEAEGGADVILIAGGAPVIPGMTVSASMWGASDQDAALYLGWVDADGQSMGWETGNVVTGMDVLRRTTVTATVPHGAASATVGGSRMLYGAQAALSWTDAPVEWALGGGAPSVVMHGIKESVRRATRNPLDPLGRLRDVSFTVSEVG